MYKTQIKSPFYHNLVNLTKLMLLTLLSDCSTRAGSDKCPICGHALLSVDTNWEWGKKTSRAILSVFFPKVRVQSFLTLQISVIRKVQS